MQPLALCCRLRLLVLLAAGALAAGCGDPNDPATMVGSLSGTIRDAATDAPLAGATVEVAGIEGETGSDGSYLIASVPVGTHPGTVTMEGYLTRTFEAEVQAGRRPPSRWSWLQGVRPRPPRAR